MLLKEYYTDNTFEIEFYERHTRDDYPIEITLHNGDKMRKMHLTNHDAKLIVKELQDYLDELPSNRLRWL